MFYRSLMVLLSGIFLAQCAGSEKNPCTKFRTGKFHYHSKSTNEDYDIERTDSIQFETNPRRGILIQKKVRWMNDCTYELVFYKGRRLDTLPDGSMMIYEEKNPTPQVIRIIDQSSDYYIFETATDDGATYRDTVQVSR